jgi:hypothetical protein
MPLTVKVCGLAEVLSVMLMVAVSVPATDGVKVTLTPHP